MNDEESTSLALDFEKRGGLLPAIVQDSRTLRILMLGWIDERAWSHTLRTRNATFWSTSRNELWEKGATSGDYLTVDRILVDCDQDTVVYQVTPRGEGACHTRDASGRARASCFYRKVSDNGRSLEFLTGEALKSPPNPIV